MTNPDPGLCLHLLGTPGWSGVLDGVGMSVFPPTASRPYAVAATYGSVRGTSSGRELLLCVEATVPPAQLPFTETYREPLNLLAHLRRSGAGPDKVVALDRGDASRFPAGITAAALIDAIAPPDLVLAAEQRWLQVIPLADKESAIAHALDPDDILRWAILNQVDIHLLRRSSQPPSSTWIRCRAAAPPDQD